MFSNQYGPQAFGQLLQRQGGMDGGVNSTPPAAASAGPAPQGGEAQGAPAEKRVEGAAGMGGPGAGGGARPGWNWGGRGPGMGGFNPFMGGGMGFNQMMMNRGMGPWGQMRGGSPWGQMGGPWGGGPRGGFMGGGFNMQGQGGANGGWAPQMPQQMQSRIGPPGWLPNQGQGMPQVGATMGTNMQKPSAGGGSAPASGSGGKFATGGAWSAMPSGAATTQSNMGAPQVDLAAGGPYMYREAGGPIMAPPPDTAAQIAMLGSVTPDMARPVADPAIYMA